MPRKVALLLEKPIISETDYISMQTILSGIFQGEQYDTLVSYLIKFLSSVVANFNLNKVNNYIYKTEFLDYIVRKEFVARNNKLELAKEEFTKDPRTKLSESAQGRTCIPYKTYLYSVVRSKSACIKALFAGAIQAGALEENKRNWYKIIDINKLKEYISQYQVSGESLTQSTGISSTAQAFTILEVKQVSPVAIDHISDHDMTPQVGQPILANANIRDQLIHLLNSPASLSKIILAIVDENLKIDLTHRPQFIKLLLSLIEKANILISEFDDTAKIVEDTNRLTNNILRLPACVNLSEFFYGPNRSNRILQYQISCQQKSRQEIISMLADDYIASMLKLIPNEESCFRLIEKNIRQIEIKLHHLTEPTPSRYSLR